MTYARSGGIAGLVERLAVSASGRAVVSEGRPAVAKTTRVELSPSELATLKQTLDAAKLGSAPKYKPNRCADCFVYDIKYAGRMVQASQLALPPSVARATRAMDAIIAAARPDGSRSRAGGK